MQVIYASRLIGLGKKLPEFAGPSVFNHPRSNLYLVIFGCRPGPSSCEGIGKTHAPPPPTNRNPWLHSGRAGCGKYRVEAQHSGTAPLLPLTTSRNSKSVHQWRFRRFISQFTCVQLPEPYVTVVSLPFPESLTTNMLNMFAASGRLISAPARPDRRSYLHPSWNMECHAAVFMLPS